MSHSIRPRFYCFSATNLLVMSALASIALPATANIFISSDRTIANGNPINTSSNGSTLWIGASSATSTVIRVPDVQVDIIAPALLNGGLRAYSNSVIRMSGGATSTTNSTLGGFQLLDASRLELSGGTVGNLSLGNAPGATVSVVISGGVVSGGVSVGNASLTMTGGSTGSIGNLSATNSVINLSGGTAASSTTSGAYLSGSTQFTMTGGTLTSTAPTANFGWGMRLEAVSTTAQLQGGTINAGLIATADTNGFTQQAALGGDITVNGGVFARGGAAIDVTGGSYTRYSGANASFFALGTNNINFFGDDLVLSGPTAGSLSFLGSYQGNFYTFTSGTFSYGQSAVGLRIFDAVSLNGTALTGGFTLNQVSAVPEPAGALLLLAALPTIAYMVRRRLRIDALA